MCLVTELNFSIDTFARRCHEAYADDKHTERNPNTEELTAHPEVNLVLMWVPIA